jgi:hypothetical protein
MVIEDWTFAHLEREEILWGPHGYHRYSAKVPFLDKLKGHLCGFSTFVEWYSASWWSCRPTESF